MIDKYERLGRGSYEVVWKYFIKDNSDIDPSTTCAIKYFLDHNGNFYMVSVKKFCSVASIFHDIVIKPFAFQMLPTHAIFMPYRNEVTLGDMFKSMNENINNEREAIL